MKDMQEVPTLADEQECIAKLLRYRADFRPLSTDHVGKLLYARILLVLLDYGIGDGGGGGGVSSARAVDAGGEFTPPGFWDASMNFS